MTAQRLPGIYFETVVPSVPEQLPRMDIAGFVGFAQSGPLDVPVAVEDADRFREIFGDDQELAWDSVRGEIAYAQLPPAVRAFFRNGGERCWVVRVADDSKAALNQFQVPGLLRSIPTAPYQGAWLTARSEGSWSDDLMVNATLSFLPVEAESPQKSGSGFTLRIYATSAVSVSPGDLLQLSFDTAATSPPATKSLVLLLPVGSVSNSTVSTGIGAVQAVADVSADVAFLFQLATEDEFSQFLQSPPVQGSPGVDWLGAIPAVSWLNGPQEVELPIARWGIEPGADPLQLVLEAPRSQAEAIPSGSWLRLKFDQPNLLVSSNEILTLVDNVRGSAAVVSTAAASPAGLEEAVDIVTSGAWWVLDAQADWTPLSSAPRTSLVTLELWVRDGTGQIATIDEVGLTPLHPRYLGYLPTDGQLFSQTIVAGDPPGIELWQSADHPRFSLAAPSPNASVSETLPFYLPLGVTGLVEEDFYQPAIAQAASALERDGLTLNNGLLSADLFLDPDLSGATANTLLTEAFHKQYQLQRGPGQGPAGEPLLKMHALLPIDEVSLLAIPDAMHPGWQQGEQNQQYTAAPNLLNISPAADSGQISASWTPVDGATLYTLEESSDPRFGTAAVAWEGPGTIDPSNSSLILSGEFSQPAGCPGAWYFRVRATSSAIIGPWSNTLTTSLPEESFQACTRTTLDPPVLAIPTASRGRVVLQWSTPQSGIDAFQLQLAYEPAFLLPENVYQGLDPNFEIWSDPSRTVYFRVAAAAQGRQSPWSNTAIVQSDELEARFEMNAPAASGDVAEPSQTELLKIHQAMLRLCAARGDVFAWMSLPLDYDSNGCLLYRSLLASSMMAEDGDRTLSFGAIYFPWLVVRDQSSDQPGAIRSVSPEGTVCGATASLTLASGAWFSPGNLSLQAVDLDSKLDENAALQFFGNVLNLVVQESRGFLTMSSLTLSPASDLAEINVRRLLILLRRLALREGVDYVFQPNDTSFWRVVKRRFEEILGGLFLQGAFAGSTQAESFQVRTDSSVNTQESIDQGRFIVELRIAPSLPLEFLTVRLLQSGGDLTLAEVF